MTRDRSPETVDLDQLTVRSALTADQRACLEAIHVSVGLMGGSMWVEDTAEQATVHVKLPLPRPGGDRATTAEGAPRPARVLIVDDSPVSCRLLTATLERRGHMVHVAANGRDGVDAVAGGGFDLVLMDLQMPGVNGLDAAARIRAAEAGSGRRIPIVALTSRAMPGDREASFAAGLDAHLAKPVLASELIALVERLASDLVNAGGGVEPQESAVDFDDLMERIGGDRALLDSLIEALREEAPRMLFEIREALVRGDAEGVERAAHRLRGSAASFSARRAAEAALVIENMGRERALSRAEARLADLEREMARVARALAPYEGAHAS